MPIVTLRFRLVVHRLLSLLLLIYLVAPILAPLPMSAAPSVRIVRVKADGLFGNSGESWAEARSIQGALQNSVPGDEIWVAAGVYIPNTIDSSFVLYNELALYGGFAGNEASREQRNPTANVTVLSGDMDNDDVKTPSGVITTATAIVGSNAYHVVTGTSTLGDPLDSSAVLDGFTITGGDAFGTDSDPCTSCGGGLVIFYGSPTLANLVFSGNRAGVRGGGMYLYGSSPQMTEITFTGNQADGDGGGMYAEDGSNATLMNVTFRANQTTGSGGGLYADSSSPSLTGIAFRGNQAGQDGGGMETYSYRSILTDVVFSGNQAATGDGGGMGNYDSDPVIRNVTFIGNRAASDGGGMYNENLSSPKLGNVTFTGNRALANGGGMYNDNSSPILTNVTFSGNNANLGGGLYGNSHDTTGQNSVMWNNTPDDISGSVGYHFNHSMRGINPLFVHDVNCGVNGCTDNPATPNDDESADDDYGDLRLQPTSSAVDAGDNDADLDGSEPGTATIASIPNDLEGQPRIVAVKALPPTVDMGAYETAAVHPTADAGRPYSVNEGSTLALSGAASSDDGSIVTYAWDCTADGAIDSSAAISTTSACTYPDSGSFTLRLTVTDNVSTTACATSTVTVANVAPIYSPASNQSTFAANAKLFTLGSFTDPGAEGSWPVTIEWGDNTPLTEFSANGVGSLPAKSHTYAAPGSFNVVVTVNDGEASDDDGFEVTVNPLPPGAPNVTAPADQTTTAGVDHSFALGSFTDPGSSGPWQVGVNWGDSFTATQFSAGTAGVLPAKLHTYAAADTYDVVVTVSDGALSASASFRVSTTAESDAGSVTGVVFADANDNGAQEAGEAGVGGAKMTLKTTGAVSGAGAHLTRTSTSDANGRYRFDNVPAGSYTLHITAPAGFATLGAVEAHVTVQIGKTTTATTFTLQLDVADGGSVFLPVVHP